MNVNNSKLRARDTDRTAALAVADQAYADGQLDYSEHSARAAQIRAAKTLSDLERLTSDLQQAPSTLLPKLPNKPDRRRSLAVGAAVLVGLAGLGVYLMSGSSNEETTAPPTASKTTTVLAPVPAPVGDVTPIIAIRPDLTTGPGLKQFIDLCRAKFGDLTMLEMDIYPDGQYALFKRDEAGELAKYDFRGGFARTVSTNSAERLGTAPFDLGQVNFDAIAAIMAGAGQTFGLTDPVINHIGIGFNGYGNGEVSISAQDKQGHSGYLDATFAGEITRVTPAS